MGRPSKWRLSPASRINFPTVLVAPFEALAVAIDKNEAEKAKSILEDVLQRYCEWPAPELQESTFTIPAPAVLERHADPCDLLLEDDEPLPDAVLFTAFQPETPTANTESDRQCLEPVLARSHDETTVAEIVTLEIAEATSPALTIEDKLPTTTAVLDSEAVHLETLPGEPEALESPAVQVGTTALAEPAPTTSVVNLDAIADTLHLVEAFSRSTQDHTIAATPGNSLATESAVEIAPLAIATGSENSTVANTSAVTETIAATTEAAEGEPIAAVAAVTETPEVEPLDALETATETPESVAVETPDLELAALQIDPVTAVETACQTEPVPVTSAVTPNESDTTATAPLPTQWEDVEASRQKLASPTLDTAALPSTPAACTTTAEHVEALADDDTSFCPKLSTPIEGFLTKTKLGQNVASETTEPQSEAAGFCQKLVAPEPTSNHALVEPQNDRQKLISEPVSVTATGSEMPVALDQTTDVEAPLVFVQNSIGGKLAFLSGTTSTDTILKHGSTNGSVEQGLKTAEEQEQSESVVFDKNTLDVFVWNNTTLVEPLTAPSVLEAVGEDANLTVKETAVTPTIPLPEPPPPIDMVQELATFAELLFGTWQLLTLAKRGELSLCWGLHVTFDYLFREGFTHMTAYRFFVQLEALLQSETDYVYGCLQVSCDRKTEPIELNGQPFNRLTFYAPGTPKHERNQKALKQAQGVVALQPTEGSEQELERIRQERQQHLAAVAQDRVKQNGPQSQTQKPGGVFSALTQLKQRLLS